MRRVVGIASALLTLACPSAVLAAEDPPDPGHTTTGTLRSGDGDYRYIRYVPRALPQGKRVPLVVMVHGAQTTAEQELHVTGFNRIAERDGFVVLYPDVDAIGRAAPGPINQSWKFYDPSTYVRGHGDAAAIADMTRDTMARAPIDPERVYVVGVSAGGLMAAVAAAAYSDLYAAAGNVTSAGYLDAFCFTTGIGIPVELSARLAFAQMGPRARVVPTMVITSDADLAFPHRCGEKALQQGLRMNNLALSGRQDAPLALTPANVRHGQVPGGRAYDVSSYRDPDGCLVAEKWLIHGMPHAWPGGATSDPKYAGYTDLRAPSGAEAAWAFLRRYTKRDTSPPCTEAPAPAPPRPCRARWVRLRVPAGVRVRSATVDGRRARLKRARRSVRVRLPATTRAQAKVVVVLRSRSGRALTRRQTFKRC